MKLGIALMNTLAVKAMRSRHLPIFAISIWLVCGSGPSSAATVRASSDKSGVDGSRDYSVTQTNDGVSVLLSRGSLNFKNSGCYNRDVCGKYTLFKFDNFFEVPGIYGIFKYGNESKSYVLASKMGGWQKEVYSKPHFSNNYSYAVSILSAEGADKSEIYVWNIGKSGISEEIKIDQSDNDGFFPRFGRWIDDESATIYAVSYSSGSCAAGKVTAFALKLFRSGARWQLDKAKQPTCLNSNILGQN